MEDYKEKYEQALERCKKEFNFNNLAYSHEEIKERLEHVFPELKEGNDEKIRKEIIECLKKNALGYPEKIRNKWISWLENQGEQKPTDKIEPKFKVGDWIISNDELVHKEYRVCRIEKIEDDRYYIDNGDFLVKSTLEWFDYHLWTIQDAKAGDVLATDNGSICIFDGTVEEDKYPFAYCGVTERGFEFYDGKLPFTHANVQPATREHRDFLFQKMKEAGYEWDSEKKELKKIKQTYSQKQEWTGYDEKAYEIALLDIDKSPSITKNDSINWLKSIKERYNWKPSDEQMKGIECAIKTLQHQLNVGDKRLDSLYDDLKKLREE